MPIPKNINTFFEKIKIPIEQRIAAGFFINVVLLLVTVFVLFKININLLEKNRLISNQQEFLNHTDAILNNINDVENKAWGYIIMEDQKFLGENFPRIHSLILHLHVKELYRLTRYLEQNEKQEADIDTLEHVVDKHIYSIGESIEIAEQEGIDSARNSIISEKNNQEQLKNKINETVLKIQKTEEVAFLNNLKKNEAQQRILNLTLSSLLSLILLLLIFVYFIIRYNLKAKQQAEAFSCENEQFLQSVIDNTSNRVAIKDITGYYIFINKPFEKIFHLTKEQIKGKTDYEIFPKETANVLRSGDLEVLKEGKTIEIEENISLDNVLHTFLATKFPLFDSKGKIYATGGIATDITEREKLKTLLQENEQRLKLILVSLGEGVIVVNTKGEVILSNQIANDILDLDFLKKQLTIEDFSKSIDAYYPDGTPFPLEDRPLSRALKGESVDAVQIIIHYKKKIGAKDRLISNTGRPVKNEKGEIIAAVAVLRDITKYKEVEEELEESQQKYRKLIGYTSDGKSE